MNPGLRRFPSTALIALAVLVGFCRRPERSAAAPLPPTRSEVLSLQDGRFCLDGLPFAEISFNHYDLFWQLFDELDAGRPLDATNRRVAAEEKALRDLHELGFRTIRIFALPWGPRGPASYADPARRAMLYAAMDKTLDLCDKYDIRVVYSLAAGTFTDTKLVAGKGWVHGEEQFRELAGNPECRGRKLLYRYIDETVARYRGRKAVLMWEISNELTLDADIDAAVEPRNRIREGQRMPTLKQVGGFCHDVAKRIKAVDPTRLVNNGGSYMRESQWHLYRGQGWKRDTFEEQFKCFQLVFADSSVDVIDIHAYPNGQPGRLAYVIADESGNETTLDLNGYMAIAARLHKPLMIGEFAVKAAAQADEKPRVQQTLNDVVDAGVPLSYWWCYRPDIDGKPNDPQSSDISSERNRDLLDCFVAANRRLRARLHIPDTAGVRQTPP